MLVVSFWRFVGNADSPDALDQLDAYLGVIKTLTPFPQACYATCAALYQVLDGLLVRYCANLSVCERTCSVLRRGLVFFPAAALEPVVSPVLQRMSQCFEQTGLAAYLWISGKVVATFSPVSGEALHPLFASVFEQETVKVTKMLEEQSAMGIPDGELRCETKLMYSC
jgi:transportin-3